MSLGYMIYKSIEFIMSYLLILHMTYIIGGQGGEFAFVHAHM